MPISLKRIVLKVEGSYSCRLKLCKYCSVGRVVWGAGTLVSASGGLLCVFIIIFLMTGSSSGFSVIVFHKSAKWDAWTVVQHPTAIIYPPVQTAHAQLVLLAMKLDWSTALFRSARVPSERWNSLLWHLSPVFGTAMLTVGTGNRYLLVTEKKKNETRKQNLQANSRYFLPTCLLPSGVRKQPP